MLCITLYIRAPVDSSGFLSLIGLLCLNKGVCLLPPIPRTMILDPLSETDLDKNDADVLKDAIGLVRSFLNSINANETMTFVDFC